MKKTILLVISIVLFSFANAQSRLITNKDTLSKAITQCLLMIDNNFDSIQLQNFRDITAHRITDIYYQVGHKSSPNFLLDYGHFERIKKGNLSISSGKETVPQKKNFIQTDTIPSKTQYCYFNIYPLYKTANGYVLKFLSLSKGVSDDMYFGEMYFEFDASMRLQKMYYVNWMR